MQAVIMAGGLGTRLKPFTEVIPKPLLPLGEKSILEIQVRTLRRFGVDEIFVATNYMSDLVAAFLGDGSRFGVTVHISREQKRLGTCGPLSLLKTRLTGPFLVVNGDILTKLNFRTFYDFAVKQDASLVLGTKLITTPFYFGNVIVDDDNHVVDIEEKPDFLTEILAGIYCLKPEIFAFIPEDTYFGMDTLIKQMLSQGQKISRYLIEDYWLDIGQIEDYSKARQVYGEHFNEEELCAETAS